MRRPPRAAVLVVLVLCVTLAGCGATDPATTTARPSTTVSGTAELPPGVSNGELTDPEAMLSAHASALSEQGFQSELSLNATIRQRLGGPDSELQNVEIRRRQVTAAAGGGARPYRFQSANLNSGAQFDVWGNETTEITQFQLGDGTQYQAGQPLSPARLTGAVFVERFLTTSSFTVETVEERDGRTFVTLTATGTENATRALTRHIDEVRSYEASIVVDGAGRIHRVSVDATYRIGGEEGRYEFRWELQQVGGVQPAPPEWLSQFDGS